MLKNIVKLEAIINSRNYMFLCDNDAPIVDGKEAIFQFLKCLGQIEDSAKAQAAEKAASSSQTEVEEAKTE